MDDLLVIILTLGVAAFSIYNQQRKKKAAQNTATNANQEPTGFWDLIMDKQGVQEEFVPEYVDPENVVDDYDEPDDTLKYEFVPSKEGTSDIKNEIKAGMEKKNQVAIEGEKFSLRKAVIYKEILNRKYT